MSYQGKGKVNNVFSASSNDKFINTLNIIGNGQEEWGYSPGFYYPMIDLISQSGSLSSTGTNSLWLTPITIRENISISEITLLNLSSASSGKRARIGLYYNRGFFPSSVYKDFGTVDIDTHPAILSLSDTIEKGRYFTAIFFEETVSFEATSKNLYMPMDTVGFVFTSYSFASGFPNLTNQVGSETLAALMCGFKVS